MNTSKGDTTGIIQFKSNDDRIDAIRRYEIELQLQDKAIEMLQRADQTKNQEIQDLINKRQELDFDQRAKQHIFDQLRA